MNIKTPSRRQMLRGVAVVGGASAVALTSLPASAYQGNMEHALAALGEALGALQAATPNKGGHRERGIHLIEAAMGEVQAGIDFAIQHGGAGD